MTRSGRDFKEGRDLAKRDRQRKFEREEKILTKKWLEEAFRCSPYSGNGHRRRMPTRMPAYRLRNRRFYDKPLKKMEKYEKRVMEMCSKSIHSLCANESSIHGECLNLEKRIVSLKDDEHREKLESLHQSLQDTLKKIEDNNHLYMAKKVSRTIRVSGLPEETSKVVLESVFGGPKTLNSQLSMPIRKIFMPKDKNEALVKYFDAKDAKTAVEKLNGYKIGNVVLVIEFVRKENCF